jgi:hypothetical protein
MRASSLQPPLGPCSRGTWFASSNYADRLGSATAGHRIVAIFDGHFHGSSHCRWHGFDVYNAGSPRHRIRS